MPTYYLGPAVRVTGQVFETYEPFHEVYLVDALEYVHVVDRAANATSEALGSVRTGSLAVAGIAVAVSATGWPVFHHPATSIVALLVLIAAMVIGIACGRGQQRSFELWAIYFDDLTLLFRTTNERVFGQVRRGLLRAMEQRAGAGEIL
jgi:hypothetical protein